jgi:hypothetical protein
MLKMAHMVKLDMTDRALWHITVTMSPIFDLKALNLDKLMRK